MENRTLNVHEIIERHKVGTGQWVVLVLCGLLMFLDGFDTQAVSYIVPIIAKQWHLPREVLGSIFSSALIGLMLGYLVISPASNRFGHKRMMVIATILFGGFTLLTVFATNLTQLIALRFLTGLGLGAAAPSAVALTCEYSPKHLRATFVLLIYCGFSLGFVVAGFAAGALLPHYGWTSLLWAGALVPLALTVPLVLLLPESLSYVSRRNNTEGVRKILKSLFPAFVIAPDSRLVVDGQDDKQAGVGGLFERRIAAGTFLLWIVFFINLAVFYFMQSWLPTILAGLNYPMSSIVWITSLPTIGGVLAVFVIGPSMDRLGPYVTLTVLYLVGGVFMLLVAHAFASTEWVLMLAIFCAGFCVSGGQKSVIALAAIFYSMNLRSTGVGWALGIGRLGGIAGPFVAGLMYAAKWSAGDIFHVAALPVFVAGVGVFVLGRLYGTRRTVAKAQTAS